MLRGGRRLGARGPEPGHHAPHLHRLPASRASRGRRRRRRRRRTGRRFERREDAERGARGRRGRGPSHADPRLRRVHPGRPAAPRRQPRRGGGGGERRRCGSSCGVLVRRVHEAGRRGARALSRGRLALVRGHRRARHEDPRRRRGRRPRSRPPRASPRRSQRGLRGSTPPVALHGLQAEHGRRGLQALQRRATREAQGVPRVRRRHGRPTGSGRRRRHSWRRAHSWRRNASRSVRPVCRLRERRHRRSEARRRQGGWEHDPMQAVRAAGGARG